MPYANNKGANQPAHLRSLVSTFVFRCLDSIIPLVSIFEISRLCLASVAAQAGLCLTWSQTTKTGYLTTTLKCFERISLNTKTNRHLRDHNYSLWQINLKSRKTICFQLFWSFVMKTKQASSLNCLEMDRMKYFLPSWYHISANTFLKIVYASSFPSIWMVNYYM